MNSNSPKEKTFSIIISQPIVAVGNKIYLHHSTGALIDELAKHFERIIISGPKKSKKKDSIKSYLLKSTNVYFIPQPYYSSSLMATIHPIGILFSYFRTIKLSSNTLIKGVMPFAFGIYIFAKIHGSNPIHWVESNPVALLKTHRRTNILLDSLSLLYAYIDRYTIKIGHHFTGGKLICNGEELSSIFKNENPVVAAASTITKEDFYQKTDTCQGDLIKLLFIGYVRPEKGVEYLINALSLLKIEKWELEIIGGFEKFKAYKNKIDEIIRNIGKGDKIFWRGECEDRSIIFEAYRKHDILILPSLSEGISRVLIEAMANSIPVVATNVGGIPTLVKDGFNGLLISSKSEKAIADAINTINQNSIVRKRLIKNGYESAKKLKMDNFVEFIIKECK